MAADEHPHGVVLQLPLQFLDLALRAGFRVGDAQVPAARGGALQAKVLFFRAPFRQAPGRGLPAAHPYRFPHGCGGASGKAGRSAIRRVLDVFFEGSLEKAVAAHLSDPDAELSSEEAGRLADLIRKARKRGR